MIKSLELVGLFFEKNICAWLSINISTSFAVTHYEKFIAFPLRFIPIYNNIIPLLFKAMSKKDIQT